MKIKEISLLKDLIKEFYESLIGGKIEKAKRIFAFAFKDFKHLNSPLLSTLADLSRIYPAEADQLKVLWKILESRFYELDASIRKELSITEEDFEEDPAAFSALLSDIFRKETDSIVVILCDLQAILKNLDMPEVKFLPMIKYSAEYKKQKEKDNRYSQHEKIINKVESKIQNYVKDSIERYGRIVEKEGISDVILSGNWRGYFHAYLPEPLGNHRIVYSYDEGVITLVRMGTHKRLGIN